MFEPVAFGEDASQVVGQRELQRPAVLEMQDERRTDELGGVGQRIDRDRALDAVATRDRQARRQHGLKPVHAVRNPVEGLVVDDDPPHAETFFYEAHRVMLARFRLRLNLGSRGRAFNVLRHCYKLAGTARKRAV